MGAAPGAGAQWGRSRGVRGFDRATWASAPRVRRIVRRPRHVRDLRRELEQAASAPEGSMDLGGAVPVLETKPEGLQRKFSLRERGAADRGRRLDVSISCTCYPSNL